MKITIVLFPTLGTMLTKHTTLFTWLCSAIVAFGPGFFAPPNSQAAGRDQSTLIQSAAPFDFDGDRKADLAVYRPSEGVWYILNSTTGGMSSLRFGASGDTPVAADYDGDGKYDVAVYRGGTWYRLLTSNFTWDSVTFGLATDVPTSADFDGDLRADVAVYRPSEGTWYYLRSSNSGFSATRFGADEDIPSVGDYDGDGRADINLFRPSDGFWYRLGSSNNGFSTIRFGASDDTTIVGDFDGDMKSDTAVWRSSTGVWYIQRSSNGTNIIVQFGMPTDTPVPADYDGDGLTDIAVFRPTDGTWHRLNSAGGNYVVQAWGASGDIAVSASRRPRPQQPAPSFTCDYYAAPTGTLSAAGTLASPWDLQTALGKTTLIRNGKTLCLRGGTYTGKFRSSLNGGGIVRSAPGEWAKIDGNRTTTLTSAITSTQTSFSVTDGSAISRFLGSWVGITVGSENIFVTSVSGNTVTGIRGAGDSIGGAAPHAGGSTVMLNGAQMFIDGSNTTYRDFEIMNSSTLRNRDVTPEAVRGNGIFNVGSANKFINLVIHDNINGIFTGSSSADTEIYGCLSFNNGMWSMTGTGQRKGVGHGLYLENSLGYSRIYNNITLNNFNLGAQLYGVTAAYVGGDLQGNVFANAGSPIGGGTNPNQRNPALLVGTESQVIPYIKIQDNFFFQPHSSNGTCLKFGYGAGVSNADILNNYFIGGGGAELGIDNATNVTVSGNKMYGTNPGVYYAQIPQNSSYTWNNNVYHNGGSRTVYAVSGRDVMSFSSWRTSTGYDLGSSATTVRMPDTTVIRRNSYEVGRAIIVVYAASGTTSVNVNLATAGLANGQSYTIRNAFNFGGPAVLTGTYNSSSPTINLPLAGAASSVSSPIGHDYTPPTTLPDFGVFVLVPAGA